jgi:DNA repair protein RadC
MDGGAAGARGFIVSHCHPSSGHYARPSAADKRLTDDIRASAKIGCPSTAFIDHVVICPRNAKGDGEYYSFGESKATKVPAAN